MPRRAHVNAIVLTHSFDLQTRRSSTMHEFIDVRVRVEYLYYAGFVGNRVQPPEPPECEIVRVVALESVACSSPLCDAAIAEGDDITEAMSVRDYDTLDDALMDALRERAAQAPSPEDEDW